jgi:hypothetical protein
MGLGFFLRVDLGFLSLPTLLWVWGGRRGEEGEGEDNHLSAKEGDLILNNMNQMAILPYFLFHPQFFFKILNWGKIFGSPKMRENRTF